MPYLRYLSTSADFITAPEEIRAGFVALAFSAHPWHSICLDRGGIYNVQTA